MAFDKFIKPTEEHEYVVGIDFGHGETSAAYCEINRELPIAQISERKAIDLKLIRNEKTIISAIVETDNGPMIGYPWDEELTLKDFQIGFKKEPEDINGREEKLMIQFMREVYKLIKNNGYLTPRNHIVYIAYPSGWKNKEEVKSLYCEMALQAGLPLGGLILESRAAFIHINNNHDLQNYMNKGLVVVDLGSSTLDLTYIRLEENGDITLEDDGTPLGASVIEECIMEDKLLSNPVACRLFEEHPIVKSRTLLFCRTNIKEEYYKWEHSNGVKTVTYHLGDIDYSLEKEYDNLTIRIRYNKGDLEKLISSKVDYQNRMKEFLADFHQNKLNGAPIYYAFLTGGASRMGFVEEIVSEAWNLPIYEEEHDKIIKRDDNPSLSVSRGIAEAARADVRSQEMIADLKKEKDTILENLNITDEILSKMSEDISSEIIKVVKDTLQWFVTNPTDLSYNDLIKELNSEFRQKISISRSFSAIANEKIQNEINKVEERVQEIVSNYSKGAISMNKQVDAPDTQNDTNLLTSDVLDSINKMIEKEIEDILLGWLGRLGRLITIIWVLPFYVIITSVKTIWDHISKTREEREAKEREENRKYAAQRDAELESNKAKRLNKSKRREVAHKISECLKSEQGKLRSRIYETLKDASELQNKIQAESKKIVEKFIDKNIEQARFLNI